MGALPDGAGSPNSLRPLNRGQRGAASPGAVCARKWVDPATSAAAQGLRRTLVHAQDARAARVNSPFARRAILELDRAGRVAGRVPVMGVDARVPLLRLFDECPPLRLPRFEALAQGHRV